jgi:hypothetical protein
MSALSEQDHLNPHHPMYYAPRWLREKSGSRPASSLEPRADSSQEPTSEPVGRPTGSPVSFDNQLETAVSEALRHPLDPVVIHESPGLARDLDRRMALVSIAGRFAAAVGVSAVVALFFVIMAPSSWQPGSNGSSLGGVVQSIRTVLLPSSQTDTAPKSAIADFQAVLALSKASLPVTPEPPAMTPEPPAVTPEAPAVTREQSKQLLEGFVQWRQKPAPTLAAEK